MPPPFFSAVSATTAPATPGIDFTARSAAARSGSSSWARAAGTVMEKNTLESAMKMSRTRGRDRRCCRKNRAVDRPQLLDDGFLGDGHAANRQR
jgi:hypothetical protein